VHPVVERERLNINSISRKSSKWPDTRTVEYSNFNLRMSVQSCELLIACNRFSIIDQQRTRTPRRPLAASVGQQLTSLVCVINKVLKIDGSLGRICHLYRSGTRRRLPAADETGISACSRDASANCGKADLLDERMPRSGLENRNRRKRRTSAAEAQDRYEQKEQKERPGNFHMLFYQKSLFCHKYHLSVTEARFFLLLLRAFILRLNYIPLVFLENILLISCLPIR